jgi:acyl-CoA reductase-like NAD-dependent aldehyde dehydrogenase
MEKQSLTGNYSETSKGFKYNVSTSYDVINPATEEIVTNVAHLDLAATDDVIAKAAKAFDTWRHIAPGERARLLRSF